MHSKEFQDLALSFPGSVSQPHFDRIAFKIPGKRIFTTLHEKSESANIILSLSEQQLFCEIDKSIFPVANKWGARGWTTFEITKLERAVVLEALRSAYEEILNKGINK
jgi:hypothetical protein